MDAVAWSTVHEPRWTPRQARTERTLMPKALFGEEDAANEWSQGRDPAQIFAPISSYADFKEPSALFLFGRRGTGKTALVHMLRHDVLAGLVPPYRFAFLLQPVSLVGDLLPVLRGSCLSDLDDTELIQMLRRIWHWLVVASAYVTLARRAPEERLDGRLASVLNEIADYADADDSDVTEILTSELLAILSKSIASYDEGKNQLALVYLKIRDELGRGEIKQIESKLSSAYLKTGRLSLVLVETEEVYRLRDKCAGLIRSALIDEMLQCYSSYRRSGLLAKTALPSEIYPHLTVANKEKIENKIVVIVWRYRDLATLIAKRMCRLEEPNAKKLGTDLKRLEGYREAKRYLYGILPDRILTKGGVPLDTVSYIVRHTQKKPRQLVSIFNCLLTIAESKGDRLVSMSTEDKQRLIQEAVHARLDILVGGTLEFYGGIYPDAEGIVRKTLTGMCSYFLPTDLDKAISQTNDMRDQSVTREDVRRLLLEAGVIGLTSTVPNTLRHGGDSIEIMEAVFEYQMKTGLPVTNKSLCVVHPMFYEELEIKIDTTVVAYPRPTEEEEMLLYSVSGAEA